MANLLLDKLVGANISFVSAAAFKNIDQLLAEVSENYHRQGETPFTIPLGASDEIGLWGYIEASYELKADFARQEINPGYIISATGSGGTAGGPSSRLLS